MSISKINLLLLYAQVSDKASQFDDWKDAFVDNSYFQTTPINIRQQGNLEWVRNNINEFDLIVILHSAFASTLKYIAPYTSALCARKCTLLSFIGDELNDPRPDVGIRSKIAFLNSIQPQYIATQLTANTGKWLYEDVKSAEVVAMPHALNPAVFKPLISASQRHVDIGVRGGKYYSFLGDTDRLKVIDYFEKNSSKLSLNTDINTGDTSRFDRAGWVAFLNNCKGTVATEAGGFFIEKDDSTSIKIDHYQKKKQGLVKRLLLNIYQSNFYVSVKSKIPDNTLMWLRQTLLKGKLNRLSPKELNKIYFADFNELNDLFFKHINNPVSGKSISSRHFDAIGTKTCQIMFPGQYNEILKPGIHYISLNKDFSNIDEAVGLFKDDSFRNKMVDQTYKFAMDAHTYSHRVIDVYKLVTTKISTYAESKLQTF